METMTLKQYVEDWVEDRANDYDNGKEGVFKDLACGGCQSGMVSELIYYSDTLAFYNNFKYEVNTLLYETLQETGLSVDELFGDKWDKEDPLALEQNNMNLLAWFAFEETAHQLANELEIEV